MSGGSKVTTQTSGPWGGYAGDPEYKAKPGFESGWGQQPFLIGGMEQAKALYDVQGGMGPNYYGGSTVAGFSPEQQMAQRATMNYATGPRAAAQQAAAEKASIGGMGGQVDYSQFQPMADVYGQQYMSEISKNMPGVRQQMVEYQPGGGSRGDIAQANIVGAASKNLAQNLAGLYGGAYSAAQERVPQHMQQYPTIMGAPLGMSQAMGDVGEQRRALSQADIDADVAKYNYQQMAPYQALANYMGTVSGDYGGSSRMTQPGPSGLSQLGQIAGIASMFSDERLKENVNKVGSFKGLDLYEFNYIWSPVKVIGFIAQEVEKVLPEAVIEVLGYKAVNYGKILGAT